VGNVLYASSADHCIRTVMQLPIWASCVLLIDIFSPKKSKDHQKNMTYLGMASGWLARLEMILKDDFGFADLVELLSLAQQQRNGERSVSEAKGDRRKVGQ
jgi:hypothetical protein